MEMLSQHQKRLNTATPQQQQLVANMMEMISQQQKQSNYPD